MGSLFVWILFLALVALGWAVSSLAKKRWNVSIIALLAFTNLLTIGAWLLESHARAIMSAQLAAAQEKAEELQAVAEELPLRQQHLRTHANGSSGAIASDSLSIYMGGGRCDRSPDGNWVIAIDAGVNQREEPRTTIALYHVAGKGFPMDQDAATLPLKGMTPELYLSLDMGIEARDGIDVKWGLQQPTVEICDVAIPKPGKIFEYNWSTQELWLMGTQPERSTPRMQ